MDVILAANAPSVAKSLRRHVDSSYDISFRFAPVLGRPHFSERFRRKHRPCPGPEILGGYVAPSDFLHVGVHVFGIDLLTLSLVVEVFEELFAT